MEAYWILNLDVQQLWFYIFFRQGINRDCLHIVNYNREIHPIII